MNDRRLGLSLLLALGAAGCHRHHHAKGAEVVVVDDGKPTSDAPAEAAPPPDTRNPGQVVVDLLATQGYTCAAEESRWSCTSPAAPWPFYVSYVPEETRTTIWFDSFELRAFGHRCAEYTNHMADLAVPADFFAVTCDDTTQQFRMNTALIYDSLDVKAWSDNHIAHRATASDLLRKAHATRK